MTRRERTGLVLLAVVAVALAAMRFDRRGPAWLPSGPDAAAVSDDRFYVEVVEYFRGERRSRELAAPFVHRPLAPLLAACVPATPRTALDLVNLAAVGAATLLVAGIAAALGLPAGAQLGGAALFAVSFPTFYYGAIGYVDPVAIAFLAAAVLLVVRGRFAALVPVIAVGCLAKETVLVAAPAALWAAARAAPGRRLRSLLFAAAAFLAGALALIAVRLLVPGGPSRLNTPSLALFLANASRPRAWLSVLLTLGPPAAALAVGLAAGEGRRRLRGHPAGPPFLLGVATALATTALAFASAYADGRPAWTVYPFAIPAAMLALAPAENSAAGPA